MGEVVAVCAKAPRDVTEAIIVARSSFFMVVLQGLAALAAVAQRNGTRLGSVPEIKDDERTELPRSIAFRLRHEHRFRPERRAFMLAP
jgi:hypothetical protein